MPQRDDDKRMRRTTLILLLVGVFAAALIFIWPPSRFIGEDHESSPLENTSESTH